MSNLKRQYLQYNFLAQFLCAGAVRLNAHLPPMPALTGDVKMSDVIKKASKHFRDSIELTHKKKVRSSHSHAVISAALGYKSKKALMADNYNLPIEDEFILYHYGNELDNEMVSDAIDSMKDSPLKSLPSHFVREAILDSLTPECECCGDKTVYSQPVFDSDNIEDPVAQVCNDCSEDEEEYATCIYCGDSILYRAFEINSAGECPEHKGESSMSDEEREDWESYIENLNKDF